MLQANRIRTIRPHSKLKKPQNHPNSCLAPSKATLRKLSFSFYAPDTIKNNKQVICDHCDPIEPTLDIRPQLFEGQQRARVKSNCILRPSKKDRSILKMEDYFHDCKYNQIEFITTNASHYDHKQPQSTQTKPKLNSQVKHDSRVNSVKFGGLTAELRVEKQNRSVGKSCCRVAQSCWRVGKRQAKGRKPAKH